jgi:hypothetical protein|tara:strand:+ start:4126 stop:4515 length:390 start_codon:yes stop_codon:yes gene_type:complete
MVYSLYKLSTGIIHGSVDLPNEDYIESYLLDDDGNLVNGYVEGSYQINNFQVVDNQVIPYQVPINCILWVREQRNVLLKNSDWTQNNDSPLSESKKSEWAIYRQTLRDLPAQYNENDEINNVVFPDKPT